MTRQVRKPGIYEMRILKAREERLSATMGARKEVRADFMVWYCGSDTRYTGTFSEHREWRRATELADIQGHALSYTEHGDFTHCAGRGI